MTITTEGTHIPSAVDVMLQRRFLDVAEYVLPHFVGSTPASVSHHANTFTAKWRRVEKRVPVTVALSELSGNVSLPTRSGTPTTITDITATVAKYGDREYITEEVSLVNPTSLEARLVEMHGIQAGESLNRLQRNELEDNSTLDYAGGVANDAAVSATVTRADLRRIKNQLERNGARKWTPMTPGDTRQGTAPILPAFWGICHVDVKEDIMDLPKFQGVETYAQQTATKPGEFGMVDEIRFLATPEASIDADVGGAPGGTLRSTSGASADLYSTVIFGQNFHGSLGFGKEHIKEIYESGDDLPAVMMGAKSPGERSVSDPHGELGFFAWDTWHAANILNADWGRSLRTGASALN